MKIELSRYSNKAIDIQKPSNGYYSNGKDNLFSNYLDGLFNNSPTHQCIIEDLTGYIIGQGLASDNPLDEPKIKHFFDKRFMTKLEKYRKIHSCSCLLIKRNALYRVIGIEIINPAQIRVSQVKDGVPCAFKYKKTWDSGVSYGYNNSAEIPVYDKFSKVSLLYWYDSGTFDVPYGRPSYISATDAIEFEIGLYMGDNHGAQNGMSPNSITTMASSGDPIKDDEAAKAFFAQTAGIAQKGKNILMFTKAGEATAPQTTLLNDNSKESKKTNYEVAESGILKGWRIPSPTLISGLNVKATGFGNAEEEMAWALATLKRKTVEPNRADILDYLEPLFNELEIVGTIDFINEGEQNETVEGITSESVNSNIKDLTGKQFQGIERIVRKFKKDQIDKDQAKMMLKAGFGLSDEEIEVWLKKDLTQLSEVDWFDNDFIKIGKTIEDFEGWEIESIEDAANNAEEEELFFKGKVELASTGTARPNSKSSQSGEKGDVQYKIRYRYSGNPNGEREFCNKMLKANKIYRYEDIVNMSFANVNAGFGINGSSNYDIFSYKGGPNCKHKWQRITFVNRKGDGIDIKSGRALDRSLSESQADERRMTPTGTAKEKQRKSETRPYDMPNRGYYQKLSSIYKSLTDYING